MSGSLVRQKGLEPLTYWFVASHSIQLSYWRVCNKNDSVANDYIFYHTFRQIARVFLKNFFKYKTPGYSPVFVALFRAFG